MSVSQSEAELANYVAGEFDVGEFDISIDGNGNGHDGRVPVMVINAAAREAATNSAVVTSPIRQNPLITLPPWIFQWGFAGVEATQSTQFFLINGQGSGAGANNSVP